MPRHIFRRTAKDGHVQADGYLYMCKRNGVPYSGPVKLHTGVNTTACIEDGPLKAEFIEITKVRKVKETMRNPALSRYLKSESYLRGLNKTTG